MRFARGSRVIVHLLGGLVWVLVAFPFFSVKRRRLIRTRWSQELLGYFGFTLKINGALPAQAGLIAANHVSWIDIFAMNALTPVAFVSKDDVIHWPIIGTLAATYLQSRGIVHLAACHADAESLVPRDGCSEVWCDQPVDVVANRGVGYPHPPQRCVADRLGNPRFHENREIAGRCETVDRWQ